MKSTCETVHEISIYIHRFHNLDLFRQGWYQMKVCMRSDENDCTLLGTPARVIQYEAVEPGNRGAYGVWKIDDMENSFATQPFCIRYARQDVFLSIMVSFMLSLNSDEVPSSSGVILRFELLFALDMEIGSPLQFPIKLDPVAIHEFRIPSKALLGLHTYCPIQFDSFYSVLVDTSIHITMLEASYTTPLKEVDLVIYDYEGHKHVMLMLIKALILARDMLLEDLQKFSKAINQTLDLSDFISNLEDKQLMPILQLNPVHEYKVSRVLPEPQTTFEVNLSSSLQSLENQILFLWNTFFTFHRKNGKKILDFLRDTWCDNRRAELSIWIVYSKVDRSSVDGLLKKASTLRRFLNNPVRTASARAGLHRQSIAQMKINNRSLQDMHIYKDPSRIPIIMLDHFVNAPSPSSGGHSYISHLDQKIISSTSSFEHNSRILKVVVFVHGFQGQSLDLRLVRNQWLLIDPKVDVLMSEANEAKTEGDFREMGLRLAKEVTCFLEKKIERASRRGGGNAKELKLSFVGHSIGNIIIRAALSESIMEVYLKDLHTYLSISGPHLGYMYNSNMLFNSGLWVLKKVKGTQCIRQLTFSDETNLKKTFLYKLSKHKTLENFKNVILVSSPQDGYIPYHSARIEACPAAILDYSNKGRVFWEMLNHCLYQLQVPCFYQRTFMRCDVNFYIPSSNRNNFNNIIGRTAHVEFLESDSFAKLVMGSFPQLFV
ncbi:Protein FAM135B [Linum perenne]